MIPRSDSFANAWRVSQPWPPAGGSRESKKNFAERFSRSLAQQLAADLRLSLGKEVRTARDVGRAPGQRGATGLDVVYGDAVSGLGLGVSIKTVTFADAATGRFTKNYTRIDHELRSEAIDHHERQPYAVLVAVLFLPIDSVDDGNPSSFGRAIERFRRRIGRRDPRGDLGRLEGMYVGLYDVAEEFPRVGFFDAMDSPPKRGTPSLRTWEDMLARVVALHAERNGATFRWLEDGESK